MRWRHCQFEEDNKASIDCAKDLSEPRIKAQKKHNHLTHQVWAFLRRALSYISKALGTRSEIMCGEKFIDKVIQRLIQPLILMVLELTVSGWLSSHSADTSNAETQ